MSKVPILVLITIIYTQPLAFRRVKQHERFRELPSYCLYVVLEITNGLHNPPAHTWPRPWPQPS